MMNNMSKTKKLTFLALSVAAAMILSYVETLLPPIYSAIPGIKIGFPNVITVLLLYRFSFKEAGLVSIIRVLLSALLFGNIMTLWYSLAGAVLSLLVMALLKWTNKFSTVGVSIAGGVFHNAGQILVAAIVMQTAQIGYYMIILAITGILSGVIIGLAGALLVKQAERLRI